MKIAYITAGAAGMYCGSCMHDNTLAKELIARGHDVQLMPLYTPLRTDEESVTVDRVFYGAINIYLQSKVPLFRHTPRFLDWLLDRPSLLRWVSRFASSTDASELGAITLATLEGETGPQVKELDRLAEWLAEDPPDLLHISQSLMLGLVHRLKERLGVPVVCSFQGEDIFLDDLVEPWHSRVLEVMRRRAREVDAFASTCRYYGELMGDVLEIPAAKIHPARLGIPVEDFRPAAHPDRDEVVIGYLARMCPAKGFHHLVTAFQKLSDDLGPKRLRLKVAGFLGDGDRTYFEEQQARLAAAGLDGQVEFHGEIDRGTKVEFLESLDLFCVPTVYREPKGLSILEAMASSVPVVEPRHGAFPEILENGGGLLFEPESTDDLVRQLSRLIGDRDLRRQMGEQGRKVVLEERSTAAMAEETLAIYRRLLGEEEVAGRPAAAVANSAG